MLELGIGIQFILIFAGIFTARAALTTARTPQGAAAWVVFLVSFPLVALPAYAVFGGISRLKSGKTRRPSEAMTSPRDDRLDQFEGLVGHAATDGNDARLLIDGQQTFDAIFKAIDAAKVEVLVQFYIIRSDALGMELHNRLVAAARRGVRVRVLCDMIGSLFLGFRYSRSLQDEGVEIRGIPGPHRKLGRIGVNYRNHRKAVVVDGRVGFTGGINAGQEYIDGGTHFESWRDTHIRLEGPMVAQLRQVFVQDWKAVTDKDLPELDTPEPAGTIRGLVIGYGPTDELERGSLLLCGLVNAAHHRLWITTPYLVPHTDLLTALQLASLRGVEVRILIPRPSDNNVAWYASRNAARNLAGAGIDIQEYRPGFMHSKVMLVDDDLASIGTINLDIRSALLNFEETALIHDRDFARQVEKMLADDFDRATPLDDTQPWHVRVFAPVARLCGPLL